MSCDVAPPEGYRLATDADLDSLPDRAMYFDEPDWRSSMYAVGERVSAGSRKEFRYAIPITAPSPEPATPQPPKGYRLATAEERACVPEKAICRYRNGRDWLSSGNIGEPASPDHIYAVPITPPPATADPKGEAAKATDTQVGGSHYKGLAIQPAEYCQRNRLPYCEANVVKYVTRHREKNGREDVEKAIHYLQLLLEIEYPKL